jgi:hypothetical protein
MRLRQLADIKVSPVLGSTGLVELPRSFGPGKLEVNQCSTSMVTGSSSPTWMK